ncbi:MAG: hypothetical protein NC489_38735, partial [Ruminococcus flavefaciens]|nr:hypothetical protein [Ruminococcus flavefaciens]
NKMANAIEKSVEKVSKLKTDTFNAEGVKKITEAFAGMKNMPEVSNSVNRMVSSIARLASAGDKINIVNRELPSLTESLRKAMESFSRIPDISTSTNIFVKSIAQLSNAGNKTGQTTAQLKALSEAVMEFFQSMAKAPQVSDATIRMMEALSRLASTGNRTSTSFRGMQQAMSGSRHGSIVLGSALKSVVATLSSMLGTIKNVSVHTVKTTLNTKKLSDAMARIRTSTRNASNSMKSFVSQLSAATGVYLSLYGAIRGLKNSVETASSLTEIQNVIDVTFGNAKQKIEDLAAVSITDFGMSELTTKQIAGRFQGMGKAAGFATGKMADMSVELTKLAADMASFYDVSQKDVAKSLESVFTGTTTPLRRYGLDITQATLQNWLLKRGIDANVQSMTQQEKIMLRYAYVMENTASAQGDFARTAGTWANQVRVLKQSFEVLGSTIGGVLINILKPFVTTLNKLMLKINDFAKIVSESIGTIFGWTYEDSTKGIVNDFEEGFEDVSDSMEDAEKNAKKLKNVILGFDQLNVLSDNSDLKNNINNLGDLLSSNVNTGEWKSGGDTLIKSFNSDLDTLEKLGEEIGTRLTNAMNSIKWDEIYEKASNFGSGLASFLNGLITPELFEALGKTIAGSLNTALHFLDSFGETFKWKKFGKSLAKSQKSFFSEFDWKLAVSTFNKLANGILNAIIAALGEISIEDWKKVAQKIADMIKEIDVSGISWKVGKIVNSLVQAFLTLVSNKETWWNLGEQISAGINGALKGMNEVNEETGLNGWEAMGKGISKSISGIATTIIVALKKVKWKKVGKAIFDFISNIEWNQIGIDLAKMTNALVNAITKLIGKPKTFKKVGSKLAEGLNAYFETWDPESTADAANAIVSNLKAAIVKFMKKLKWSDILDKIENFLGNLELDTIGFAIGSFLLFTKAGKKLTSALFKSMILTPITNLFTGAFGSSAISSAAAGLSSVMIPVGIGLAISLKSVEWKEKAEETEQKLQKAFKEGNIGNYVSAEIEKLTNPYNTINSAGGGILDNKNRPTIEEQKKELEKNGSWFGGMMTDEELEQNIKIIKDKIEKLWDKMKLPVEGSLKNAEENIKQWKSDLKQKWDLLKLSVSNKLETTKNNISEWKDKITKLWNNLKLSLGNKLTTTKEDLNNFKETLKEKWGTFKVGIWNKLETTGENIENFYNKISHWWGERKLALHAKLATLKSDVSEWFSSISHWWGEKTLSVKIVFETVANKVKGVVDSIGNLITGGSSKKSAGYSLRGVEMPQYEPVDLGWYAKGGIFDRASIIGVGESGREAVLPLENPKSMALIAESIMDNYTGVSSQNLKEEIKDAVIQGMMEVFMATRDSQSNQNTSPVLEYTFKVDSETFYKTVLKGKQKYDRRYNI